VAGPLGPVWLRWGRGRYPGPRVAAVKAWPVLGLRVAAVGAWPVTWASCGRLKDVAAVGAGPVPWATWGRC